jgi:hypothetical protein
VDGVYAGYHPAGSAEALRFLSAACKDGVEFLVVPVTATWWLSHYRTFGHFLSQQVILLDDEQTGLIVDLRHKRPRAWRAWLSRRFSRAR